MLGLTLIHVSKTGYKRRYVNWNSTAWQLSVRTKLSYRGLTTAFNAPKPEQNCHHFAGDVLKCIYFKDFFIQLKFLLNLMNQIDNKSTLIEITACCLNPIIFRCTEARNLPDDELQEYQPEEGVSYSCQVRLWTQIGGFPGHLASNERTHRISHLCEEEAPLTKQSVSHPSLKIHTYANHNNRLRIINKRIH